VSLKRNVVANYVGQGCRGVTAVAFIPLYVKYLGIESYGLIGIFAILQSSFAIFDMGMRPALGREMARFTAGAHDSQSIRNMLRSVEMIGIAVAAAIALSIWCASGWLASDWLSAKTLPNSVVAQAFTAMGLLSALRFVENIYISCIVGLQRQVLESSVSCSIAIVRGLSSIAVLAWVSPSLQAFFLCQCVVSLMSLSIIATIVYGVLPSSPTPAHFSLSAVKSIWRFAAGIMAITMLALLLTQVDKILLTRLLPLKTFAYYALAGVLTSVLYMLNSPVNAAFYPRFTEYATRGDLESLRRVYHQAAQLSVVVMGSAAIVLIVFADDVLRLWTHDPTLAQTVSPLLRVLAFGTLLNGLMGIPYQMQLANGWTGLTIKVNTVAVALLVPGIFLVVPKYGAIGAAWIWVTLNVGYLVIDIYFMHRRLLRTEKWRWYGQDIGLPLLAAASMGLLLRLLLPKQLNFVTELAEIMLCSGCIALASALACPLVRVYLIRYVRLVMGHPRLGRRI
jgi:O-antigen/teichoic acid export membrane protein